MASGISADAGEKEGNCFVVEPEAPDMIRFYKITNG